MVGLVLVVCMLLLSTHMTYKNWLGSNRESLLIAKSLQSLPEVYKALPIVLEKIDLAPLVKVRLDRGEFVGSYINLFWNPVPNLGKNDLSLHLSGLQQKNQIYEYLFRSNITPERFKERLIIEANARSGHFLAFFFSFMDHWYPMSSSRRVRDVDIKNAIPIIVDEYAKLLKSVPKDWRGERLQVSSKYVSDSKECKSDLIGEVQSERSQIFIQVQRCE